jgi:hypothetical protein
MKSDSTNVIKGYLLFFESLFISVSFYCSRKARLRCAFTPPSKSYFHYTILRGKFKEERARLRTADSVKRITGIVSCSISIYINRRHFVFMSLDANRLYYAAEFSE